MDDDYGWSDNPDICIDDILPVINSWLHKQAYYWANRYGLGEGAVEDLVQEGRIAVWQAGKSFDPDMGISLRAYALTKAKHRIHHCISAGRVFGRPPQPGSQRVPVALVDRYGFFDADEHFSSKLVTALSTEHNSESVLIKYHEGEILSAINELNENQRYYCYLRFWCDMSPLEICSRYGISDDHWRRIRAKLQVRLQHLQGYRSVRPALSVQKRAELRLRPSALPQGRQGGLNPNAKLTDQQRVEIRRRYIPSGQGLLLNRSNSRELATEFGVSTKTILRAAREAPTVALTGGSELT